MQEIAIYTQPLPLQVKEYRGQRVLTFKDIDTLHQRPEGTAKRNFNENRNRFIEGEDYFILTPSLKDEFRTLEIPNRGLTVVTKIGYLMLVKSFTDDLAWHIQRQLVKSYFETHAPQSTPQALQSTQFDRLIAALESQQQAVQPTPNAAPTMLTIKETVKSTGLPEHMVRTLAKSGKIVAITVGVKYLINYEKLIEYLNKETEKTSTPTQSKCGTKRIPE